MNARLRPPEWLRLTSQDVHRLNGAIVTLERVSNAATLRCGRRGPEPWIKPCHRGSGHEGECAGDTALGAVVRWRDTRQLELQGRAATDGALRERGYL